MLSRASRSLTVAIVVEALIKSIIRIDVMFIANATGNTLSLLLM